MNNDNSSVYVSAEKQKDEELILNVALGQTDSKKSSSKSSGPSGSKGSSSSSNSFPKKSSSSKGTGNNDSSSSSSSSDNIFSSSDEECFSFGAHAFILTIVLTIIFLIICLPCVDSWMGCYFNNHNYRVGMKTLLFFIFTLIIVWVFMWKCTF